MFDQLDDTIVAISTPCGQGTRGVVRMSGPGALAIGAAMFRDDNNAPVEDCPGYQLMSGRLALDGQHFILPAELFVFRGPRSYAREDVVEVHTVGAATALALIVDRAIQLGARQASPGEFTARAFCRGAMNLGEVEGVAALLYARSDQQLRAAREWLGGGAAALIHQVHTALTELVALVEADIDFAEEPIDFIQPADLQQQISHIAGQLRRLLQQADDMERANHMPRVMLVGRPNAGKSTLMNRLSGLRRALCSPLPGTTRDFLSTVLQLPGGEIELIDTPGMAANKGKFENFSKIFLERELPHTELVCHLLDLTDPPLHDRVLPEVLSHTGAVLWVANKCDCVARTRIEEAQRQFQKRCHAPLHIVSAARGDGIEALRQRIDQRAVAKHNNIASHRVAINVRHRGALQAALDALHRGARCCTAGAAMIDCAEWVAADLRMALSELGTIFGEVTTEDLLQRIFSGFCIGK